MKISELEPGKAVPFLRAQIMSKKPVMETKYGKVCDALIEDDSGTITLTLWHEQTEKFNEGEIVVIKNAWCKEYKELLQISSGKHGTIENEE